ncbi:MAG TPA: response regulator [Candidatus Acidoferrales bacterium]|nr:response regulator [Candidatus Acidoferrales bacterium]
MNILVAEDDRVQSRLLEKHLQNNNHRVQLAFDVEAAWKLIEKGSVDVILLDLLMPGGTGLGFLKRLRAETLYRKIPVIVVTSVEDPLVRRMAEIAGVDAQFTKPINYMLLDITLESIRSKVALRPAPI